MAEKKKKRSMGRNSGLYARARAYVLAHNNICQFKGNDRWPPCGHIIDMTLAWPDPMSPTTNHITPVGDLPYNHPLCWDVKNLEPMHLVCNQRLGDGKQKPKKHKTSRDWLA